MAEQEVKLLIIKSNLFTHNAYIEYKEQNNK